MHARCFRYNAACSTHQALTLTNFMNLNRFSYLDGLRGIAAFFVLTRHTEPFWNFTFHRSYLAVDIFFILSGFVISMAYDEKLSTKVLAPGEFFKIRVIRLYPILLLSLLFSAAFFACQLLSGATPIPPGIFSLALLFSLFLIPVKFAGYTNLFIVNGPFWSLFYEIIVNVIYAFFRPFLLDRVLIFSIVFFAAIVSAGAIVHSDLDVGFNWGLASMCAGFSRAMLGISIGLLLHRKFPFFEKYVKKAPPVFSIILMALVFCVPALGKFNALVDIVAITLVFPVCVYWGAIPDREKKHHLLQALGSASYPLYVLHVPFAYFLAGFFGKEITTYAPFSGVVFATALILLSIASEKIYDIPVRRWLSKRFLVARTKVRNDQLMQSRSAE